MKKYPIINRILALSLAAAMLVSAPMGAFAADAAGVATVAEASDAAAISGDNNSQAADGAGQKTEASKKADATTETNTSGQASDSASTTNKNSSDSASTDIVTIADDSVAMASEEGADVVESDTWPGDNDIAVISDDTSETEAGTLTWYCGKKTHKAKLVVVDQDGKKLETNAYSSKINKEYNNQANLAEGNDAYADYISAIAKRDIEGYTFAGVYYKDSQGNYTRVANLSFNASENGWCYVKYENSTVESYWSQLKRQSGSSDDEITLYVIYDNDDLQRQNITNLKLFYYSYDNGKPTKIADTREVSVANDRNDLIDLSQYVKETIDSSQYTYDRASVFNTSGMISNDSNVDDITITSDADAIWKSSGWGDNNIAQELKLYKDKTFPYSQRVEVYVGGEKINDSYSYNPDRNGIAVVFIYEKNDSFDNNRVSTKDSIKINLFDYTITGSDSQSEENNNNGGINARHDLIFSTGQPGDTAGKYNKYEGNGRTADIVQSELGADGMPVLNVGDNQSLAYLFNTTEGANKKVDEGLDKLFTKDDDGYYVFDSASSFATISGNSVTGSKDFKVYNYASDSAKGFFPYTSHTLYGNDYQKYGDALGSQSTNHYVGMTIETTFVQPKDGQIDGKAMVFEFSGDDDVWVFIDGQLVLDLGGIHPAVSGTINFKTGKATYTPLNNSDSSTVTNFMEDNQNAWSAYTKHTLKMFYLERGNGASNCSIKMNLATIPEGGFIVAKDATGVDATIANNIDYKFVVKNESGNVCPGLKYTIGGDTGTTYTTDDNGCFTLKSGQYASFSVENDKTYTVSEIAATCNASGDSTVSLNNFTTLAKVVYSTTDKESKTYSYAKNEADRYVLVSTSATDTPIVVFSNSYYDSSVTRPEDYIGKTAELDNYDERTYNVTLQARKTTLELTGTGSAIDLILVMDTSASMLFHADLKETNITSINQMNKKNTYYGIRNNEAATVYEIKYEDSTSTWKYIDDSIDDWNNAKKLDTSFLNENLGGKLFTATSDRTRYYYFKQTACNLIDKLPTGSYFGLVTFNSSASIQNISGKTKVVQVTDSNRNTIKNKINGLGTSSGTRQDLGLGKALKLFENNSNTLQNSGHNKYVVMISDGSPGNVTADFAISRILSTKSSIESIVDKNDPTKSTKIYSIGLDTSIHTSDRDYAEEVLKAVASSVDCYKSVTSANLDASIKSIIASITGLKLSIVITTGQVVDVIDPRFDLYDDDGNKVDSEGTYTIGGKQAAVTVENGIYTVTWNDQTLGVKGADGITPWTVTFKLKAKDDFLGGNVIATNGSESGVKTGTDTDTKFERFDQPAVNVKVLDFKLASDEEYVFKGDKFSVYKSDGSNGAYSWFLDNMSGKGASILKDIVNNNDYSKWPENADGTYTYTTPYSYGNTSDEIGTITYTFTPEITEGAIKNDGTALKVGSPVATWSMTVSYAPISASDRQNSKTDLTLSSKPGTEVIKTTSTGTYNDNVVTIALKLMKYGNGQNDTKYALANAEFTLSSDLLNSNKQTTGDGTNGSTLGLITFADLKAGTYTLKETAAPEGWALNKTEYTVSITKQDSSQDDSDQAEKNFIYNVTVTHKNGEETVIDINCTVDLKQQLVKDTKGNSVTLADLADSQMLQLNVYDQMAYELPHTGGSGVCIYIISGILLMLVGALLLYKNKNNKKQ